MKRTPKSFGLKRTPDGYEGYAYWMTKVTIKKLPVRAFKWILTVERKSYANDGGPEFELLHEAAYRTLGDALVRVAMFGRETVKSKNLMSGKEIEIELRDKGGCCDPGTETYWSM